MKFINKGEISPGTWKIFGMSAKETDNPIGMFGTGLKYAIAVLLRELRQIIIYSGLDKYEFKTESYEFRGSSFERILCNGEVMPFTTDLGKKWKMWMAYREIASNCFDEDGYIGNETPKKGLTIIQADLDDILHEDVFLNTNRLQVARDSNCEVYAGNSWYVYYRGVRAYELSKKSIFTYNVLNADISEDRNIKYWFEIEDDCSKSLMSVTEDRFIKNILFPEKDTIECSFGYSRNFNPSNEIVLFATSMRKHKSNNPNIFPALFDYLPEIKRKEISVSQDLINDYDSAITLCKDIGFENIDRYPVKFVSDLPIGCLAMADRIKSQIYLSERVLHQGIKQIAATMIEEYIHLAEGYDDCTYEMQTYLFDLIVTMGKKSI